MCRAGREGGMVSSIGRWSLPTESNTRRVTRWERLAEAITTSGVVWEMGRVYWGKGWKRAEV